MFIERISCTGYDCIIEGSGYSHMQDMIQDMTVSHPGYYRDIVEEGIS